MPVGRVASLALLLAAAACDGGGNACGPETATVTNVVDGDTIDIEGGLRVRYLGVDTPEIHGTVDCYGPEAASFNTDLVLGQKVRLEYDVECRDRYDRLLAYVWLGDRMVDRELLERGYARLLIIAPNGTKYADEFRDLEHQAEITKTGLWGACP